MELKDLIKAKRISLGLNQREVADLMGISRATISRWEAGKITNIGRDKAYDLCQVLDISPIEFIGKVTDPKQIESANEHRTMVNYRKLNSEAKVKANNYIMDLLNAGYSD